MNKLSVITLVVILISLCTAALYVLKQTNPTMPISPSQAITLKQHETLSECQIYYRDVFANAPEYGKFEDYRVTDKYSGPTATLDEESHAVAKRFYSYHVAALEKGVTFGGKYTISDWAYTGWGQMFAVIDVETGEVYPFPYTVDWDFEYQVDSNLIIINPVDSMADFANFHGGSDIDCEMKWFNDMKTYYFVFEDKQFKLLGPEDTSDLLTSEWLSNEEMTR